MIDLFIFKTLLALTCYLFLIDISLADGSCGSDIWTKYMNEKCIVFINKLLTQPEAEDHCKGLDNKNSNSIDLISIDSKEEQDFLNKYLSKHNIEDSVWIGLTRVEESDHLFHYSDEEVPKYENWVTNKPSNDIKKKCVQMRPKIGNDSFASNSSQWEDVVCYKKNLIVCQKYILWDQNTLQKKLTQMNVEMSRLNAVITELSQMDREVIKKEKILLNSEIETYKNQMKSIKKVLKILYFKSYLALKELSEAGHYIHDIVDNPVPVGFIYVQLPGQMKPSLLWPTVKWTDISEEYNGLFFRVIGNGSESFGLTQEDNSPRLTAVSSQSKSKGANKPWRSEEPLLPNDKWSKDIYSGADNGVNNYYLNFKISSGEVRPKNTAIIVWKRTKELNND